MKIQKSLLLSFSLIILLVFCSKNKWTSIEGLWITTEGTSSHFLSGTQKVALQINADGDKKLTARGVFLWNGDYQSNWNLVDVRYDTMAHKIIILDEDADTLICRFDPKNESLIGAVHLQDKNRDTLNFIRADNHLATKLFCPRTPGGNGEITYRYRVPEQLDDGLQTTSFKDEGIDSSAVIHLMKEIIAQQFGRIESLLILKDNKLIAEEYFYGYTRTSLHKIHSCTKSVTSLLLGIALDQYKENNVEQPLFDFFPPYDSLKTAEKEQITLKNALTMTSGLEWHEYPEEMYETDDCFGYILSRSMESTPGVKFHYSSGNSILLGGVIQSLEGRSVLKFANTSLFNPLGITNYFWETNKDGTLQCGGGLSLYPRDMAKIGLLVLNDGKWQDKQVVPKAWIHESTRPHVQESPYFDYGYQWWHHSKNNLQWWKEPNAPSEKEHDLVTALGTGGQFIMIIRDLNLVVVTTASDYDNDQRPLNRIPMAIEEIIPIFEAHCNF